MTADRDDLDATNRNHADGTPRRLAACAQANPANDDYHPGCCRFPKSCSPYPYAETPVTESDLEPRRDQPPPADRDDLAAILAKHEPSYQVDGDYGERQWIECTCDSEYFVDTDAGWAEHRAHVAQMVLESDWLRDVKAGVRADVEAVHRMGRTEYRADRVDAEDTDNTTDRT